MRSKPESNSDRVTTLGSLDLVTHPAFSKLKCYSSWPSAAVWADGRVIASISDETVYLWDAATTVVHWILRGSGLHLKVLLAQPAFRLHSW
jgi:hypothetical protein